MKYYLETAIENISMILRYGEDAVYIVEREVYFDAEYYTRAAIKEAELHNIFLTEDMIWDMARKHNKRSSNVIYVRCPNKYLNMMLDKQLDDLLPF